MQHAARVGVLIFFILIVGVLVVNMSTRRMESVRTTVLSDGTHLGFIRSVRADGRVIAFDEATWLTGLAAEDAAIAAGHCTEESRGECVPNDYFIENTDKTTRKVALPSGARMIMQTYGMEESGTVGPREVSRETFVRLVNDQAAHWKDLPYELTVQGGVVVQVEEVYIP